MELQEECVARSTERRHRETGPWASGCWLESPLMFDLGHQPLRLHSLCLHSLPSTRCSFLLIHRPPPPPPPPAAAFMSLVTWLHFPSPLVHVFDLILHS